jgi:mRNA interferase MazF
VLVLSRDAFNLTPGWRSVTVVPFSGSRRQMRRGITAVPVPAGEGGLARESVALCHQITTLDRRKLDRRLGALSRETLARIESGVKASLGLR